MSVQPRRKLMLGLVGLTAAFIVVTGCVPDPPPAEPPVTTIHINEVESNGGTPGDWVELINTGTTAVDLSGWSVLDGDDTHIPSVIPAGTSVAPGGYYIVEEAALGFGLGAADSVRLYDGSGGLYETSSWTAHAATTYGRCPNGNRCVHDDHGVHQGRGERLHAARCGSTRSSRAAARRGTGSS